MYIAFRYSRSIIVTYTYIYAVNDKANSSEALVMMQFNLFSHMEYRQAYIICRIDNT